MRRGYQISADGKSITCQRCGKVSYHPEDVRYHYCGECHRFHNDVHTIDFWVVYDHPTDYPDCYVLRKQMSVFVPGELPFETKDAACRVSDSLDELRAFVPKGAINLGRHQDDDPVIIEVWMV